MRFTFFAAVVAACNFITTPQASSLVQHQPQLFDEPATIFAQVDPKEIPMKEEEKKGPAVAKPAKKPQPTTNAKKTALINVAKEVLKTLSNGDSSMNDNKVLALVSKLTKEDETLDDDAGSLISNFGTFRKQLQ